MLLPPSTLVIDLVVGALLVTVVSTLLERTVLTHVMEDPVRSHLLSLFVGWVVAAGVVVLMNPWRSEVPLLYALAAIPVAWWRVRQGREERVRIGHHRAEQVTVYAPPPAQREVPDADEEPEPEEGDSRDRDGMLF